MTLDKVELFLRIAARYFVGFIVARGILPQELQLDPEFQVAIDFITGAVAAFIIEQATKRAREKGKAT